MKHVKYLSSAFMCIIEEERSKKIYGVYMCREVIPENVHLSISFVIR